MYTINILKLLFSIDDHLFRIKKAEAFKNLWKLTIALILVSMTIYAWMAMLGIGSDIISGSATEMGQLTYEESKLWFVAGRIVFAVVFACLILFLPALILYSLTGISFKKLVIMQQMVLFVMLTERIIWIPLVVFLGLDWYVSPMSFGIIASYITEMPLIIYFFGAISIFQLWIIWFQVKFIGSMSLIKTHWLWTTVILLHLFYWLLVATLAYIDTELISGWFE
ncbi:hypothetical protein ACFQ3N_12080 [Virgibacillus byunsanensis]|uniref:Yip1 domain-containing protein n=1 Tax=Virgibacillus byunsanensis TaxID=570945 RepID=A0ABW3LL42_9BACI